MYIKMLFKIMQITIRDVWEQVKAPIYVRWKDKLIDHRSKVIQKDHQKIKKLS